MNIRNFARVALAVLAMLMLCTAAYCFLWIASSYSMAFTECGSNSSLFSENPRCRQPAIASLLCLASLVAAVAAAVGAWRLGR
ncbi:hypothetical protein J2X20_005650 [Pelomonas saccharophila]|uniref:Transmembrane protein n=1 Tax=Roseateles saccharophilus TaxID=304 RepID=A0ABU1YVR7_ROSSA|nr:hypothetical protein [Roseateles saccharophilus]MDR7272965.1 hypothetical protein [Roseateles saccharophilus]